AAERRASRQHRTVSVGAIERGASSPPRPSPGPRPGFLFSASEGRMAIPKVMGIETEYGITVKNQPDFNPILSSLLLINSYETFRSSRVRWDYEAESPLRDARGFEYMEEKEGTSKEESRLINLILSNGAGVYVRIVQQMMPFFVSRQIFTGAGKVGAENNADACDYQISQRADFLETEVGLETMHSRPIINTRDEPHADPEKYRRLHVIVGDANMSEVANYLKCGTMAIVLSMIEDDFIERDLSLESPVLAYCKVSRDLTCRRTFKLY